MSDLNLNTPTPSTPANSSESAELKAVCSQLASEAFNLKVVLLIVVFALALFFWREASFHNFEVSQMQGQVTQASQIIEALKKQDSSIEKQLAILRGVATRLGEYGKLHPDYAQILAKYGVVVTPPQAPAAAPATKPGVTPVPPKR
jgi:hypothetical protein